MLNLPHSTISYTLQRHVVLEIINNPFHESLQSIHRWTGVTLTNEHAQRIILDAANEFTPFYHHRASHKADDAQNLPLLILTSDGKGVVMNTRAIALYRLPRFVSDIPTSCSEVKPTFLQNLFTVPYIPPGL